MGPSQSGKSANDDIRNRIPNCTFISHKKISPGRKPFKYITKEGIKDSFSNAEYETKYSG